MKNKKPYRNFGEPGVLTDDTLVLGIPVKDWYKVFAGDFEENLRRGNEIIARSEQEKLLDKGPEKSQATSTDSK
jgi:hypothetical protein